MAGSAISRALTRKGYGDPAHGGALLTPTRQQLDLLDGQAVSTWMQTNQPDVVVLAAATVGGIEANRSRPADFLLQNLSLQTHVMEAAWQAGTRRLLFLGSSCIYPKFAEQPIREEALLTGALEPTNEWYAIAKIAGIKLAEALRRQHGFDAISLMPTNLYGPGDNYHPTGSHVLPALIRRFHEAKQSNAPSVTCWGSGTPLREFLHADDLGEACVFALEHWSALAPDAPKDDQGAPLAFLNVGTGIDLSIGNSPNRSPRPSATAEPLTGTPANQTAAQKTAQCENNDSAGPHKDSPGGFTVKDFNKHWHRSVEADAGENRKFGQS